MLRKPCPHAQGSKNLLRCPVRSRSLVLIPHPDRQHIAGNTMQHSVGRGSQQEPKSMSSVGADDDEIDIRFLAQAMHLVGRIADENILTVGRNPQIGTNQCQSFLRLLHSLLFQRSHLRGIITRQAHGAETTVYMFKRPDDMHQGDLGTSSDANRPLQDFVVVVGQIKRDQSVPVYHLLCPIIR